MMPNPIEILYFGHRSVSGHFLHCKSNPQMSHLHTPWGAMLDRGLLTNDYYLADSTPTGEYVTSKKDGWTAVSFWDRSGSDKRPGCNSTFLAHADLTAEELLKLAREQWPELFMRLTFTLKPK